MLRRYVAFLVVFAAPFSAFAVSLYFSPASQTVSVGQTFSVDVDVSSPDVAMNAAAGDVSFPTSKLKVVSISTVNSAMNLWVQNPTFSNAPAAPDVDFAGIVLSPGFIGDSGNVIRIRFQALATGNAVLSFSVGSVLANDGSGTNILDSLETANIKIVPAVAPTGTAALPTSTGNGIAINSGTIPVTPAPLTSTPIFPTSTQVRSPWWKSGLFVTWGLIGLLATLWLVIIAGLIDYAVTVRRGEEEMVVDAARERQELHDDVQRIERELGANPIAPGIPIPPIVKEKQDIIHKEIEHLEEDLKKRRE